MFDNVTLHVENAPDFSGVIPLQPKRHANGVEFLLGFYGNLRVKQYQCETWIEGSIPKLVHGENISPPTLGEMKYAIQSLENTLNYDLSAAKVTCFEFGKTLEMAERVRVYTDCMEYLSERCKPDRINGGQTVRFRNECRSFQFYDKIAEVENHKQVVPEQFQGKNLLRLELKQKARVKQRFGPFSAYDLFREEMYNVVMKDFEQTYFSIQKKRNIALPDLEGRTPKQFDDMAKALGYQMWGIENVFERIRNSGNDRKTNERMRNNVRKALNVNFGNTSDLIEELDGKVRLACTKALETV